MLSILYEAFWLVKLKQSEGWKTASTVSILYEGFSAVLLVLHVSIFYIFYIFYTGGAFFSRLLLWQVKCSLYYKIATKSPCNGGVFAAKC